MFVPDLISLVDLKVKQFRVIYTEAIVQYAVPDNFIDHVKPIFRQLSPFVLTSDDIYGLLVFRRVQIDQWFFLCTTLSLSFKAREMFIVLILDFHKPVEIFVYNFVCSVHLMCALKVI